MPKGKGAKGDRHRDRLSTLSRQGKGKVNSGNSGAERRAIARDLPAIKAIAESCDELRREWEHDGGDVSKWDRVHTSRDGVVALVLSRRGDNLLTGLARLPDAIGTFFSLTKLYLQGCPDLQELPDTIGGLASLEFLIMSDCPKITSLPDAMGKLRKRFAVDADTMRQATAV